ncbi:MAG: RsmD family RNA methyltransferase [Candidatus Poseidoniaceae archaeon]
MAQTLACLRGWNIPLAQAELAALLPETKLTDLSPRFILAGEQSIAKLPTTLSCSSGIQCFLHDVQYMDFANDDIDEFMKAVSTMLELITGRGSLAVRYLRIAGRIDGLSTQTLAGEIGGLAVSHGYSIDLSNPEYEIGLIADGDSNILACGWLIGDFDDSIGTAPRRATERPFFRPISLDPRLARLAVNLACGPIDEYAVLDPMTGTGGFAMEAITMGRNCIAIDMDNEMITGAKQNIEWALQNSSAESDYQIMTGDACNLEDSIPTKWHGKISGVVLDPPYGRNSHGTHAHFDLISNTIDSMRKVVSDEAKLVLIIPIKPNESDYDIQLLHGDWNEFVSMINHSGAKIIGHWQEHVHASLARLILLATIAPQD